MCDGLVVDLDDAIGSAPRNGRARLALQLDDAGRIAVDSKLGAAREHAVAFDPLDALLPHRHVRRDHAGPAVGRAANNRPFAVAARIDTGLYVMRIGNRLDGIHPRRAGIGEEEPHLFDALAFRGLHGDEGLQFYRRCVEPFDIFA